MAPRRLRAGPCSEPPRVGKVLDRSKDSRSSISHKRRAHSELHGFVPLSSLCPWIDGILGPEPPETGYHFEQTRVLGVTNLEPELGRWQLVVCYH